MSDTNPYTDGENFNGLVSRAGNLLGILENMPGAENLDNTQSQAEREAELNERIQNFELRVEMLENTVDALEGSIQAIQTEVDALSNRTSGADSDDIYRSGDGPVPV